MGKLEFVVSAQFLSISGECLCIWKLKTPNPNNRNFAFINKTKRFLLILFIFWHENPIWWMHGRANKMHSAGRQMHFFILASNIDKSWQFSLGFFYSLQRILQEFYYLITFKKSKEIVSNDIHSLLCGLGRRGKKVIDLSLISF